MATLHTIKAHLYNNALTEDPNDYVARVSAERSLSIKDICQIRYALCAETAFQ
ncbi:hypothetical protein FACS189452_00300 [Bacteroidia bacterium]|nr:hypothetical protein FACS189452_00300 [Bacteroidia bacterium]GHT80343.1 hypothetical protein FACS189467_2270 [Bacteroidia bacterium]